MSGMTDLGGWADRLLVRGVECTGVGWLGGQIIATWGQAYGNYETIIAWYHRLESRKATLTNNRSK